MTPMLQQTITTKPNVSGDFVLFGYDNVVQNVVEDREVASRITNELDRKLSI